MGREMWTGFIWLRARNSKHENEPSYFVIWFKFLSEILSFRTLSIVLVLKNKGKHDVSETGSFSVLRCGKKPILLGPLERAEQLVVSHEGLISTKLGFIGVRIDHRNRNSSVGIRTSYMGWTQPPNQQVPGAVSAG
jgi:hypothetical protein